MKIPARCASLCLLISLLLCRHAFAFPREARVPGGLALIALGTGARPPQAWLGGERVAVLREGNNWVALVGLSLALEPGDFSLLVRNNGSEETRPFRVSAKSYPLQRFSIEDRRKVEPSPEDLQRIEREQQRIAQIKATFRDDDDMDADLRLPAKGRLSGSFGLRRIINGLPRNPHAGLDIVVPSGTPVRAAAPGRVIETGDFFFNGESVYLDHGQGLITLYCHLEQIDVRPGQTVSAGELIGRSGRSGRATGPHLHWSVILNGAAVDPRLFLRPQR